MKFAILALTRGGEKLALRVEKLLPESRYIPKNKGEKIAEILDTNWRKYDGFLCIMATGIVVRSLAPLLRSKADDPSVLVLDEKGENVISLLSGHIGGANALTKKVASLLGARAVITTASDKLGLAALDLWAVDNGLFFPEKNQLTALSAKLVNEQKLHLFSDIVIKSLPSGLEATDDAAAADFIVSHRVFPQLSTPCFRPKNLVVGIGCNRGTPVHEFETALDELFTDLGFAPQSIRNLASIDKKNDEVGLLDFAVKNALQIDFFDKDTINSLTNLEISPAALKAVGAIGVAEPAALLSAGSDLLLSRKRKWKNVTMAVTMVASTLSAQDQDPHNI